MYLAEIADAQPPPTAVHSQLQFTSSSMMQPASHYMQHQQAQQMTPQSIIAARSSTLYTQQQYAALQQQQALHSQLGISFAGSAGLHMLQRRPALQEAAEWWVGFLISAAMQVAEDWLLEAKRDLGSSGPRKFV